MLKQLCALVLSFSVLLGTALPVQAQDNQDHRVSPVAGQTWEYLNNQPAGQWSITVCSLGQREIREDAKARLYTMLETGRSNGFRKAHDLELSILALVKLGQDPSAYQKTNLLSTLSSHENLYEDGLENASPALMAYTAAESPIFESARNSIPSVTDYLVSSQQRSGGFAPTAGRDPDVIVTADAITALAPQKDVSYVSSSLERALSWLSEQQNPDGTFNAQGGANCRATAAVLTAISTLGIPLEDARFVKEGGDLLDALFRFQNTDGGFSMLMGEPSSVEATEYAALALYADQTGLSPHLSPSCYPGYAPSEPEQKRSAVMSYLQFLVGFLGMLAIIYALLLLTTWIGKKWGDRRIPFFGNPYDLESSPEAQTARPAQPPIEEVPMETMEIHIPMQAELPDFDTIPEMEPPYPSEIEPDEKTPPV